MNAKKICALALSLGLSASYAPKSDAGLIKDAAKAAAAYATYKAANILIPKYTNYSLYWESTKEAGGKLITFVKGYIDMGVDNAIKFAEQKFELEKKIEKNYNILNDLNDDNDLKNDIENGDGE